VLTRLTLDLLHLVAALAFLLGICMDKGKGGVCELWGSLSDQFQLKSEIRLFAECAQLAV